MTSFSILPKNHEEFKSKEYWDRFFIEREEKSFEWYGTYPELRELIRRAFTPASSISSSLSSGTSEGWRTLVIGCGNSDFSSEFYDDGFTNITNIDFSEVVIDEMQRKNLSPRPAMSWLVMDMTNMEFSDGNFDVVFDKVLKNFEDK
jgi:ubiquinone/menaquinone biosynthesis C-methylase UbiE